MSLGALRKRGKGDVELDDYVCPMDLEVPPALKSFVIQRSRRSNERSEESMRSRKRSDEDSSFQVFLVVVVEKTPHVVLEYCSLYISYY